MHRVIVLDDSVPDVTDEFRVIQRHGDKEIAIRDSNDDLRSE